MLLLMCLRAIVLLTDHILLLPHLEAFRFLLKCEGDRHTLDQPVAHFLRKRDKLRGLDLGNCPWNIVRDILPDLKSLRVLAVLIGRSSQDVVNSLVESIPSQMMALSVFAVVADRPLVYMLPTSFVNQLICPLGPKC
jgi:hypothetical protein